MKRLVLGLIFCFLSVMAYGQAVEVDGISSLFHGNYSFVSSSTDKGTTWTDLPGKEYKVPAICITQYVVVNLLQHVSLKVTRVAQAYDENVGFQNYITVEHWDKTFAGWWMYVPPKGGRYMIWVAYYLKNGKPVETNRLICEKLDY